jgi:hypothetical protein
MLVVAKKAIVKRVIKAVVAVKSTLAIILLTVSNPTLDGQENLPNSRIN